VNNASGDTIFAVASGAGRAAVTLLRLSGPDTARMVAALCGRLPAPRTASLRALRDASRAVLDRALVLWLPGPGSYTGEDSAELHLHGGPAVLAGVSDALVAQGARPAEAGEFTQRAFHNGRMDLVEAEAVADLVAAETAAQRSQALRQMDGALGDLYRGWARRLTDLVAWHEALIDFPDEDLPPTIEAAMLRDIQALCGECRAHLDDGRRGERLRDGLVFAVTGPPNVGKSTLVNALVGREVAIVSATPGTTRDVLEARIELGGVPVTFLDTAGLRETDDEVEAEGVRRATTRSAAADLVLAVQDASAGALEAPPTGGGRVVQVVTKIDLDRSTLSGSDALGVSARTGEGMAALHDRLAYHARSLTQASGPPALTRPRHRAALTEVVARLNAAATATLPELRGEDMRMALRGIGRITGSVGVEDVLDAVFRQFCIGK
jgi:tRNA modification GTPase